MSLDPFEARLQFLKLVRTLNASQQSIQKLVSFAVKYGARCADDLWECVVDEVAKVHLNARINILYFLDSLAETSSSLGPPDAPYLALITRDLPQIVAHVVPPPTASQRDGVLNLKSARAILESWRARRVLDPTVLDGVLAQLDARKRKFAEAPDGGDDKKDDKRTKMSKADVLRRIEEDRERQKRLRERIWILPIPPLGRGSSAAGGVVSALATHGNPSPASPSPFTPASPAAGSSVAPPKGGSSSTGAMAPPPPPASVAPVAAPLDVEFDLIWETTSDLGEDDVESMREQARQAAAAGVV